MAKPHLPAAIGYVGEVSVPNGPATKGYFLDRWVQEVQPDFEAYVRKLQSEAFIAGWKSRAERDPLIRDFRDHEAPTPPPGLNPYEDV